MPRTVRRVLVVEDEWILAFETEEILVNAGYVVIGPVPTVREALALLDSATVDAALLDINLTHEMSYPVANALLSRGIPFMFVSGFSASDIPARYRDCPMTAKPAPAEKILAFLDGL